MTLTRPRLVVIAGPTASGKSALAIEVARRFGGEVVNADSQQVYRGLDIGTGKPGAAERGGVVHHLFDVVEPWEQLDAARFASLADEAIEGVASRGHVPVVVGGTGLWIRALLKGLVDAPKRDPALRERLENEARRDLPALHRRLAAVDPEAAARIHATDPTRIVRALEVFESSGTTITELHKAHARGAPRYGALQIALDWQRPVLDQRIRRRAELMFRGGLLDEAPRVAASDPRADERLRRIMGYREALAHLEGRLTLEAAIDAAYLEHRRYAKRQGTWFRAEPEWQWVPGNDADAVVVRVGAFLDRVEPWPPTLA